MTILKDLGFLLGKMEHNMKANGLKGRWMGKEKLALLMENALKEYGVKGNIYSRA